MQQILYFFIKNSYRLLFLLLLGISFALIIQSHSFHRSEYINSANNLTGGVYENINSINEYLSLKEKNEVLAEENTRLKELLFNKKDTLLNLKKLKLKDSLYYTVTKAKVIKNSFNVKENFLTINAGEKDSIKNSMGVINEKGIVGIIEKTSKNYATIISILNTELKINAKIKSSNHFGSLNWDGKNVGYIQLIDVPRLANIKKGDSIVTGANSDIFPENIPIGKIDQLFINKQTNYYTINIRLFNDMTALGYVYIISNSHKEEKQKLEKETLAK
ncbi:rod shape-determining protein MreC [Flavobacterium jejuense]|uniref:Cell shape-determining protein MreC n=1 Tax=Flavobacterium jejuense TaxID=1544455 RepID=A0ABX0IS57_9FLAO|nr:rod shape-determining protein MreC [Flavobacterium jejuense]NHN26684.1 rod shape-determining protein MreC [Flavobacterium jejuense]